MITVSFLYQALYFLSFALLLIVAVLIAVAYYTLLDRKILGAIQRRTGPSLVGFFGILQPLADGLKLFAKETLLPTHANNALFLGAPIYTFILSMVGWGVIPFSKYGALAQINTSLLFVLAMSALGVLGVIFAGWSSNSKYAFLGALRSSAQMISYEVSLGFIILSVVLATASTNLIELVEHQAGILNWHCWFFWPQFILFLISAICETNRAPFDLPEAEAELVAGYFVDYSALTFALFFLAEYSAMLIMAALTVILFMGGWTSPFFSEEWPIWFGLKIALLCFFWVHVRGTLPRYRFDALMELGWKSFLPLSLGLLIYNASFLSITAGLPLL